MTDDLRWGSDVVVRILQQLDLPYVAINPGASFRGIHESLVHAGDPEIIVTQFEGNAVSIAHGYAKASGRVMASMVHNLVGLQHASMAIFNAYADGVPVMVIGGSGPADHTRRRPWIDWVHTVTQQSLVVRDWVKWDAQPVSLAELPETFLRAYQLATSGLAGPTYVSVDALIQESAITSPPPGLDRVVPMTAPPLTVADDILESVAQRLSAAEMPVIVTDYTGRSKVAYEALVGIAERLATPVIDLEARHSFPNTHWADCTFDRAAILGDADLILVLDPRDTRWALTRTDHEARGFEWLTRGDADVIVIGLNELGHSGFLDREPVISGMEMIVADTAVALPSIAAHLESLPQAPPDRRVWLERHSRDVRARAAAEARSDPSVLTEGLLAAATFDAVQDGPWHLSFAAFRNWARRSWVFDRWNCHLGGAGGAGLSYAPGATVGAALAHRDDDTLVVSLQPDGDFLYAPNALWTAAHHRLPMLMVVVDNGTYGNDWLHQTRIAQIRGRSEDLVHIGIDIDAPRVDIAALARAQGVEAWTIDDTDDLGLLAEAARYVRDQRLPAVVDARVEHPTL